MKTVLLIYFGITIDTLLTLFGLDYIFNGYKDIIFSTGVLFVIKTVIASVYVQGKHCLTNS